MKRVLLVIPVLVLCLGFWLARGDYSYYYSQALYPANWSNWTTYGTVNSSCYSSYCGASGGGLLLSFNWPGEVRLTIARDPAANDFYATYFGATNSVWGTIMGSPPQEVYEPLSYLEDAELNCWGSSGTVWVTQATYDTNNGRVQTSFASANVACSASMTLRAVSRGSQMLVYVNNVLAINYTGIPGGNFGSDVGITLPTTTGSLVTNVDFGYLDTIAPNAIPASSISKSAFVNHVDLSWPAGTDDANGTGVYNYEIWRNGGFLGSTTGLTFSDTTVNPSTTYTYTLKVVDFHGNGANTNFSITTPYIQTNGPFPSATPEGRRVGVRATGAYWGASGENIDVMSGNLSFALPLVKAQARSGWGVGFNLAYNSQNWRYDSGGNWEFGGDVGYGFGWRLLAGSITPVFSDPYTVSYYLFTDSTGAEYRLDQNSGGIWSSKESIYVYYDPSVTTLHFRDGSFWYFGCISASTEADSGVMYPTIMEDTNGNQVLVNYQAAPGATWTNSSARIVGIEDVRGNGSNTYTFTYNNDSPRHLTGITSNISTGENYTFTYLTGQALYSPFSSQSFGTVAFMRTVTITTINTYHQFTYNGSGEITQILLPYKGYLSYDYTTMTYSSGRSYREVQHRNLSKDGISSTQYAFSHEPSPGPDVHQYTILDDPGGVGEKYWAFATSGLAEGLVTQYQGRQFPVPATTKVQNDYTWAQDAVGNSYIATAVTTADPGQPYAAQKKITQTVDTHGNVTQVNTYNYGNLSTPMRTDNYTYLNNSSYTSRYIFNRMTSSPTTTISYDQSGLNSLSGLHEWDSSVQSITARGNPTSINSPSGAQGFVYDIAGGVSTANNNGVSTTVSTNSSTNYAAPSQVTVGSLSSSMNYNSFLGLTNETDPNGAQVSIGYDAMARPNSTTSPFGAVTTNSYSDTSSPPTMTTTVNGRWTKTTMDGLGRPIKTETGYSTTTVSVAETEYDSCGCSPLGKMKRTALAHAPGATPVWTTYTYDGIGRTLTASTVGTDTQSSTSYVYQGNTVTVTDAAGKWKKFTMDALGQLVQVNEPNPAGGSDYVTTYGYDSLGHLTSVNMPRPSGTQARTFVYSGNSLVSATNPENGTVSYTYNGDKTLAIKTDAKSQQVRYTYDSYKRVTQIQRGLASVQNNVAVWAGGGPSSYDGSYPWMSVSAGGQGIGSTQVWTTQNYNFTTAMNLGQANIRVEFTYVNSIYDPAPSAGNVTVNGGTYSPYSSGGGCTPGFAGYPDLQSCDVYYDYPTAQGYVPNIVFTEDTCQRETYSYDTNPYDSTFSQYAQGRLTAVQYKGGYNTGANPTCDTTFTEMYSYSQAGGALKKRLQITRASLPLSPPVNLDAAYTYDNEGRMTATQYPSTWNGSSWVAGPNLGYGFDGMGRLQTLTDLAAQSGIITNATYNPAGQLLTMSGNTAAGVSETREYNSLGQLTHVYSCPMWYGCTQTLNVFYNYSATQNNGKIASQTDSLSGEQITYTYDSLNRLASATGSGWGQSYNYDGFGNLTDQNVTSGTAPALHVAYNALTNRRTDDCADANGNLLTQGGGCSGTGLVYDVENRVVRNGGTVVWAYSYGPGNKRVWRGVWSGSTQTVDEVTYWGANGQKLATYQLSLYGNQLVATATGTDQYFGGKLIKNATGYVTPDRLGSIGKYFPYGQERPSATQDGTDKFATYFRDSETGLDYAQNRYHQPGMGRFLTPDPNASSADPKEPSSWNRYSYTGGDPVNRSDSTGLDWIYDFSTGTWHSSLDYYDLCYMNAGACQQMFSGSVFAYDLGEASWWNFLQFSGTYDLTSDYYYIAAHGGNAVGSDCRQAVTNAVIYQRSLDLGLNFYNLGFTNSSGDTTVAGYTVHNGGFDSQTEMLWTGGDWNALQQQLEAMGWQHSTDTLHGDFSDSWRQPGAEYSMQISHDPNTGNFQVDIDPHNPNGALLGHTWDVIRNTLTYSDTNYNDVANHFGYNVTACP